MGNKWWAVRKNGNLAISLQFDYLDIYSEGLVPFENNGKAGYIDNAGKMVIQPEYDYAMPFYQGLASVKVGTGIGYIDKTGKFVFEQVQ